MSKIAEMLALLPENEQQKLLEQVSIYKAAIDRERAQKNFMAYVRMMWPGFVAGRHHALVAKKFEGIADGTIKRLIINMAPRHTKSEFASYLLPSWFLGRFPHKKVIQTSNTADLAVGFGRKVRNLVGSEQYSTVFPDVSLRQDSKAAGRWATNKEGEYFAIGVGGTVTGKGADLLIIDDPHSEQEAAMAAGNPEIYDKVYEWYTSGPRQRLQPGGAIVIVMCMTGDTDVLMADKTQKKLRDIRPGDEVATYEVGYITTSKINNWQSSGVDSIYSIQTQSGIILRANKEHPFLVEWQGERKWVRLKNLIPGMLLVATKDAIGHQDHRQSQDSVQLAKQEKAITEKTQKHLLNQLEAMACGLVSNVNAGAQFLQKDSAPFATASNTSPRQELRNKPEQAALNIATDLQKNSTSRWFKTAITFAMSAVSLLQKKTRVRTGTENFASTTATTQAKSEDYSATIATLPSDTESLQRFYERPLSTYNVILDPIISINAAGEEEVFDIEVDRTANFIANGVVSHNTRWGQSDLTGRVVKDAMKREKGEDWEVIELPAILPSGNPLWPEFWSLEELEALKEELPASKWNAQYQQSPTGEEGAIVKREWWKRWKADRPPPCEFIIQSWDTAFTKGERNDYSACTTWGVFYMDENPNDVNVILLDAFKKRMEFPELKQMAHRMYLEWEPDAFIVEAKASGLPLIMELRQMGIPVSEFTPSRGNDKFVRLNAVTDLFNSGKVWAPDTRQADEVIEERAVFPNGSHDDYVDSTTQALIRFRQGGFLRLDTDDRDDFISRKKSYSYY
jgi:predicted phage terminase large subunit-like protein